MRHATRSTLKETLIIAPTQTHTVPPLIVNAVGAVPSGLAAAWDTGRQRPAVAGAVAVAAGCRSGTVVPVLVSCRSLAASVPGCVACRVAGPLVRVRCLRASRQPSRRRRHSRCR